MTKGERIQAVIRREPTDRAPYALWRHFPAVDRSAAGLAQSTLRFHERYGADILAITPAAGYAAEDWGSMEDVDPGPDGSRPIARHAIGTSEDWKRIRLVEIGSNAWGLPLEAVIRVGLDRRADAPVIPTLFGALSVARKLAGERLGHDLRARPASVADALEVITEMNLRLAEACFREGAEGIFYVAEAPPLDGLDAYADLGEPHDRRVLDAVRRQDKIGILHAHGQALLLDRLAALPADLWSWEDRRVGPSILDGLARVPGAVIGGLDQHATLRRGTPDQVKAEAREAITQAGGLGLVLGPGCALPPDTPDGNLVELARSLGGQVRLGLITPRW